MPSSTLKLFEKEAPLTIQNFVGLSRGIKPWKDPKSGQMVKRPLYSGTIFHRGIPQFMIQGGDPQGTGYGDPGYAFKDEFDPSLRFDRPGRLAMANAGPNTNGSQFFITEVPYPSVNNRHTIFGQVVEGEQLVAQIARVPRDLNDRPRTAVVLQSITIQRVPVPGAASKSPTASAGKKTTPGSRTGTKSPAPAKKP